MTASKFIGQPVVRIEDAALLKGAGRFVDDVPVRDALEAAFVRSAFAHARIRSIDVTAARAAPGVHAVLTYADIRPRLTQDRMPLELRVEALPDNVTPYPLARDEVVFAGEAIVAVIAESRYAAEDAAALVRIDYEPLPAVADRMDAIAPGAARVDTR
jgi:aerobic carbon-monoxide dehydrogenase large subunit